MVEHNAPTLASHATDVAGAIGTWVAAVVALGTLAFLCIQWTKDRNDKRKETERAQAALINFWIDPEVTNSSGSIEKP